MQQEELVTLLTGQFYDNFAEAVAAHVCETKAVGMLYALVTSPCLALPRDVRHKVLFRGAYVLEKIYFNTPEEFTPYLESFFLDFSACSDASARRHFTKIMAHALQKRLPKQDVLECIADSAAQWAIDPSAKVAVRIGAVEVLKCCRERIGWVADAWDDLLAAMAQGATPGIRCRMRKSWRN